MPVPETDQQWLDAVDRLQPVPAAYRVGTISLTEAAKQLGCSVEQVAALIEAGLPAEQTPDGPMLDYHDVSNIGLVSGTGKSLAEQSERRLMRMAAGSPDAWLAERSWRIKLIAECTADDCTGEPPAAPAPELLDGRLRQLDRDSGQSCEAIAEFDTRGGHDEPRTAAVRAVFDELFTGLTTGYYQFSWLPRTLRAEPAVAARHRMVDCVVAAWLMRERAAGAGLQARTRKGYLLGMIGVEHAWTEVLEEGRWLPLDPILAFLALRQPASNPEFTSFCRGSVHNRLLGWPAAADEPLTEHACAHGGRLQESCRQLPAAQPAPPAAVATAGRES
ncbi:MAG: transglutaminase domain-containing protein [Actinomycetota bacterium]|nr:transglutaminase domain-containing protein [Actinomycetota bacterium]